MQSCLTLWNPMHYSLSDSSVHRIFQARILELVALLQGIFPTQGSNPGLPHCRQILYHLSHQGSSVVLVKNVISTLIWIHSAFTIFGASKVVPSGKEPACQCRRHERLGFNPWVRKIPWSRKWQPTPVLLPGQFCGQRRLASYSPCARKESDMAEHMEC